MKRLVCTVMGHLVAETFSGFWFDFTGAFHWERHRYCVRCGEPLGIPVAAPAP